MVSISGMAVSLKTDLQFSTTGQRRHGSRNIQIKKYFIKKSAPKSGLEALMCYDCYFEGMH